MIRYLLELGFLDGDCITGISSGSLGHASASNARMRVSFGLVPFLFNII